MATRAVFLEAARNQTYLKHLAESGANAGPITDAAFWANLPQVCSLLTQVEVSTLGAAYVAVPQCERIRAELATGRQPSDAERRLFANCFTAFADVTAMLGHRVYRTPVAKADATRR